MSRGREFSPEHDAKMPFFFSIRRKEDTSEFKHRHAFRTGQDIALQNIEKR